ncbi:hypothetical protein BJF78_23155 [Pseudonocardia sp. CNS-139]|nr:hypothetical protein BJF78_23155 [Pseudonocardia sp. CNS-139]
MHPPLPKEKTMKFALLYVYDPTETSPTEGEIADWVALDDQLKADGVVVLGEGFHSRDEARVVRVRDGATAVATEPTAPAAHTVAGFYVLDVPSVEAATEIAARIPTAGYGYVEVRRVVDFDNWPD